MITNTQIQLFRSLFVGREDVFALRWEKGTKSGYMPAYQYDPYSYRLHKMKGGTFKNYNDKAYLPLNDTQITKHLTGEHFIGIYPLLKDDTSHFIVADFDKKDWQKQVQKAVEVLNDCQISAYVERSRSGNGGHVWVFFDTAYPAVKSRKIILSLFEKATIFSTFDKSNSFDRLFPNQNYLSGKGLGNLIALPLHGTSLQENNSCFINPNTFDAYKNQWGFLSKIQRVSTVHLNSVFDELNTEVKEEINITFPNKLQIKLANSVLINRNGLTPKLINFIKDEFNFYNSDFFIKKKLNKNTFKTKRFFNVIDEFEHYIQLPKGSIGSILRFCTQSNIDFEFVDDRKLLKPIPLQSSIALLPHQKETIQIATKKDIGIIVAPPSAGKTIIGLKIIEQKKQPALIIVHRKQILEQWLDRIETFFGIPKKEIGRIGQGKMKIGKQITVTLIQSLSKKIKDEKSELLTAFGTIIIDECHRIPATSFRETIQKISSYYQYGLTATPFRKTTDEKLIFAYLGSIISEIKPNEIQTYKRARVEVINTELSIPFNSKTDRFETLSKVLIHDFSRNKSIVEAISKEVQKGRKAVIITERNEHILILHQYLKSKFQVVSISGENTDSEKSSKWKTIQNGDYQIIITTGQYFGEGTDIQEISCLFLVYPFTFKGKLIQYIGRVQRSELKPIIYDFRDAKIPYLDRMFLKRNAYYNKLDRQATLFDDFEKIHEKPLSENFRKTLKIPITDLEFHYGFVSFKYGLPKSQKIIQFDIENETIQPEFEVLKPYFSKILHSKFITTEIEFITENGVIISQLAMSKDLEKIDKEIVDSVKFRFVEKQLLGKIKKK